MVLTTLCPDRKLLLLHFVLPQAPWRKLQPHPHPNSIRTATHLTRLDRPCHYSRPIPPMLRKYTSPKHTNLVDPKMTTKTNSRRKILRCRISVKTKSFAKSIPASRYCARAPLHNRQAQKNSKPPSKISARSANQSAFKRGGSRRRAPRHERRISQSKFEHSCMIPAHYQTCTRCDLSPDLFAPFFVPPE
jgi:hypothetical protein